MAIFQSPKNMNQNSKLTAEIDFRSRSICSGETERKKRMLAMDSRLQRLISPNAIAVAMLMIALVAKCTMALLGPSRMKSRSKL
jgi:hypothetical protein